MKQSNNRTMGKCPYCHGTKIIKKGLRRKKYEAVQVWYCHHCGKKFTPLLTKGKTYPLRVILEAITWYNRFHSLEESARQVSQKYGLNISYQNISNWLKDLNQYITFSRMRGFIARKYKPCQGKPRQGKTLRVKDPKPEGSGNWRGSGIGEAIVESKMFHGQIYDFKYHRAKTDLILQEDFKHYKFQPLQEFLELVIAECPHSIFKETKTRASELGSIFNLNKVKITPRQNMAVQNARLILQAVANNKLRHEVLQEFMLVNDSVTVATEVPVLLDEEDIRHYRDELGFEIPLNFNESHKTYETDETYDLITGHIDLLQIRNGAIHILDYKPSASKAKPVDQLTLYALALARLTGLRLFHFKCAWFDEEDYFEFYPLHIVYKKKRKKLGVDKDN